MSLRLSKWIHIYISCAANSVSEDTLVQAIVGGIVGVVVISFLLISIILIIVYYYHKKKSG